ncbi:hypothetical protein [Porphyromonas crevioricanis]|uniref:CDP-Glycerol:Poly(Glycerophosphate) glycerophosphotransferase n=1 Tax=Porphyromonas crevioricanis TaxID=393921 RepID=A0AB34PIX2_9PORP|nr:hypothetical protein [Porphyromonas crevioricanis]KGN95857.1 hypothetical protein HQ38_02490 [Porphyromonas crevioricanis]
MAGLSHFTSFLYKISPPRVQYVITQTKAWLRKRLVDPRHFRQVRRDVDLLYRQLKGKSHYRVLFIVSVAAQWKQGILFRLLEQNAHFEPAILLTPYSEELTPAVIDNYQTSLAKLKEKGYTPIEALSPDGQLLNIAKQCPPDLIYYITPYDVLLPKQYRMSSTYKHSLICYSRYGYVLDTRAEWHKIRNFGYCWQLFLSSKIDSDLYQRHSLFGVENGYASGPLIYDEIREALPKKENHEDLPLVILAPHHSIESWGFALSNFLRLSDYYLSLPHRFAGRLRFAFKPHPHLKAKLYRHSQWGRERTDEYYKFWDESEGCYLELGPYADLFAHSAAMVHDCAAFSVEYLLTQHPVLFIRRNHRLPPKLNEIGKLAYQLHQLADSEEQIDRFLESVAEKREVESSELWDSFRHLVLPHTEISIAQSIMSRLNELLNPAS